MSQKGEKDILKLDSEVNLIKKYICMNCTYKIFCCLEVCSLLDSPPFGVIQERFREHFSFIPGLTVT